MGTASATSPLNGQQLGTSSKHAGTWGYFALVGTITYISYVHPRYRKYYSALSLCRLAALCGVYRDVRLLGTHVAASFRYVLYTKQSMINKITPAAVLNDTQNDP